MATTVTYKGATLTTVDNTTKTLETAGTWMEDDLTLTDVSGGGGGGSVLDTITIPADTRAVDLDFTGYDADFLFVYADITLSAADWLYFVQNGSSPSGGTYTNQARVDQTGFVYEKFKVMGMPNTKHGFPTPNTMQLNETDTTNLYIYTYNSGKNIMAGSKFYVIGGKYADL